MALETLKKGYKIGLNQLKLRASQVEKELVPLVKAGKITAKDAKTFVNEATVVAKKAGVKAKVVINKEAKRLVTKMGYVSKDEVAALKKRVAELERQVRKKKK